MSPGRSLIVNADDLGRTKGINSGIFEAHSSGLVTSATLMVGFPAAGEAAARLDEFPAQIAGRLNLTLQRTARLVTYAHEHHICINLPK